MRGSGLTRYPAHNPTTIMPTLDDAPILETLSVVELEDSVAGTATSVATQDLILIYDQSRQTVKTITVKALMESFQDVAVVDTTGTD